MTRPDAAASPRATRCHRAARRPFHLLAAAALVIGFGIAAGSAAAEGADGQAAWLSWPADCELGQTCYIQNFVDRDAGPGWQDVACRHLGYNDHKGTDIALVDEGRIAEGVAVRAAADGIVLRARDGMEDARYGSPGAPDVSGRQCGNGLVVDHGGGWESQYCHLRKGSIAVQPGTEVKSGDKLGEIGESGQAAFPHLHFELRRNGQTIDPMDGRAMGTACHADAPSGAPLRGTLWRDPVPYRDTGVIALGFADREVDQDDLRRDSSTTSATSAWAKLLVFWVRTFGLQAGDIQEIEVRGPDGAIIAESQTEPLDGAKVMSFLFAGRRRPGETFPPGIYTGTYRVLRVQNGQTGTVVTAEASTEIVALRDSDPAGRR